MAAVNSVTDDKLSVYMKQGYINKIQWCGIYAYSIYALYVVVANTHAHKNWCIQSKKKTNAQKKNKYRLNSNA